MASTQDNVSLFLQQTGMSSDTLQSKLIEFFHHKVENRHILYKQSILYLFEGDRVVDTVERSAQVEDNLGATVFSFDGDQVSRVEPEYYLGENHYTDGGAAGEFEIGFSNNCNNNNNNNNNGNNNG